MSKRILYVCTYWGVRSSMAKLLTDSMAVPELESEAAGFESGVIGAMPRQLMENRGLELSKKSPDSVFSLARKKNHYDCVVALCGIESQENYDVLLSTLHALFPEDTRQVTWNIPDFMSPKSEGEERMQEAEGIVQLIEHNITMLLDELVNPETVKSVSNRAVR